MLERYFIRPATVDRIRASWIGVPIEQYVTSLSDKGYAARNVFHRVPVLVRFGEFARERGATRVEDLPAHIDAFVEHWTEKHGTRCSSTEARQKVASSARNPVERQIEALLGTASRQPDRPVFVTSRGQPLTRFGVYKLVRRHTRHLEGRRGRVGPHVFRHTTAVHLLEAGVEVNVIRGWLGHVGLDTTNRYAEINMRAKEAALQACEPPATTSAPLPRKPVWRNDEALLAWLDAL
jgi:hypothetical protein